MTVAVILDAYTVEPSGLGVPPYLSTYARNAYAALSYDRKYTVHYLTIDDFRAQSTQNQPTVRHGSNPLTYSLTKHVNAVELIEQAEILVVIAGDAVPSKHMHAVNGSVEEIEQIASIARGRRILMGPMTKFLRHRARLQITPFEIFHTQTITPQNLFVGSVSPASYSEVDEITREFEGLIAQLGWTSIAEIELYRGCTRHAFCSFCNEPAKNPTVAHRPVADILKEVSLLYSAGVRNFRLGQQTCFFSYHGRDVAKITELLEGIRALGPDIDVLHIDNVDPLAAASKKGRAIARLVAQLCSEGNVAPMGIESFDPVVVGNNDLTCTPDIAMRAIENVNEFGASTGPRGLPRFIPGINLVYGLPGETAATHRLNIEALNKILDSGAWCHRTNVRKVRVYDGTPLQLNPDKFGPLRSDTPFEAQAEQISTSYDRPMKQRVYPEGRELKDLHSFFFDSQGTWYRRLGSYSIQVLDPGPTDTRPLYAPADVVITGHNGRFVEGARL